MIVRTFRTVIANDAGGHKFGIDYIRTQEGDALEHRLTLFAGDLGRNEVEIVLKDGKNIAYIQECSDHLRHLYHREGTVEELIVLAFGPSERFTKEHPEDAANLAQSAMLLNNLVNGTLMSFISALAHVDFPA